MADLTVIARIPNVASAVLGDLSGGFYDAVREGDGESVAAVAGFVSSALERAGEDLGLGALQRVAVAGEGRGSVIAVRGATLVAVKVDQPGAVSAVEQALEASLRTGG
jgi:predicted regulator of Ras-like GTPase activity (Roadblock/LC7/MglB family)